MRIPKHLLQYFIESNVEPEFEGRITDEMIVTYLSNPKNSSKKFFENTFPVHIVSKTVETNTLFGPPLVEYLAEDAKFYNFGIVKKREDNKILVECRSQGYLFFLRFVIDNKPVQPKDKS